MTYCSRLSGSLKVTSKVIVLRSLPTFLRNIPIRDGSEAGEGAGKDVLLLIGPDAAGAATSDTELCMVGVCGLSVAFSE